nr:deoxyribodipyrimidine photo-lyase [candidate division Zixibacteria bacterium]
MPIDKRRIFKINDVRIEIGPIVYWMSRDQRVNDNWSLHYAMELADHSGRAVAVIFNLVPEYLGATLRQYNFMLKGLWEVQSGLEKLNIPFFLLTGQPEDTIPKFLRATRTGVLITDFSPLKINLTWQEKIAKIIKIPFYEVDSHNIVPCRYVSKKQEFAARTIRPKINRILDEFLTEFPSIKKHKYQWVGDIPHINWTGLHKRLKIDKSVKPVPDIQPGQKAAMKILSGFIRTKLSNYANRRNNPDKDFQSGLSPYLHFGNISAQRVAIEVQKANGITGVKESFLEELIVRRELSDNFCFYNCKYDAFDGFPEWARKSLDQHRSDPREFIYSLEQLEQAETHDRLWNTAQMEMVKTGKMHGYMRMYWAKKILEWSPSPERALETAIYLNDRYELDGRDPNGYAGIAWSIGGVHDRPWLEREIFGKIRFMSFAGCKRKFHIEKYIDLVLKKQAG